MFGSILGPKLHYRFITCSIAIHCSTTDQLTLMKYNYNCCYKRAIYAMGSKCRSFPKNGVNYLFEVIQPLLKVIAHHLGNIKNVAQIYEKYFMDYLPLQCLHRKPGKWHHQNHPISIKSHLLKTVDPRVSQSVPVFLHPAILQ